MAISADLNKVFEVGPVFRAENSNTRRHLCEFTGLDVEMAIHEHYDEVLDVCHATFKHMFQGLEARWPRELAAVREQYASAPVRFTEKPCVVHWPDGIAMLREAGVTAEELGDFDDLSGAQVLSLTLSLKLLSSLTLSQFFKTLVGHYAVLAFVHQYLFPTSISPSSSFSPSQRLHSFFISLFLSLSPYHPTGAAAGGAGRHQVRR
jgi:aspartyl/asparaginyl-tRNA synthetase